MATDRGIPMDPICPRCFGKHGVEVADRVRFELASAAALGQRVEILAPAKIDLVAGGPPCQPFSRAGRSKIRSLVKDPEVAEKLNVPRKRAYARALERAKP